MPGLAVNTKDDFNKTRRRFLPTTGRDLLATNEDPRKTSHTRSALAFLTNFRILVRTVSVFTRVLPLTVTEALKELAGRSVFRTVFVVVVPFFWVMVIVALADWSEDQLSGARMAEAPCARISLGAANVCGSPCGPAQDRIRENAVRCPPALTVTALSVESKLTWFTPAVAMLVVTSAVRSL